MSSKIVVSLSLGLCWGCATSSTASLDAIEREYAVGFLRRNPVVNTYLGGVGLDASLGEVDAMLRDHSKEALEVEDRWLEAIEAQINAIDPRTLAASDRIDREVMKRQITFLLRQHRVRRWEQRAIDTYVDEGFRGVDWQIQGMTPSHNGRVGTDEEWSRVARRARAIVAYLEAARVQLLAGVKANNVPDRRLVLSQGIRTVPNSAKYFEEDLQEIARKNLTNAALVQEIEAAGKIAATAYREFGEFLKKTYFDEKTDGAGVTLVPKPMLEADHYPIGETEYDFALANNLGVAQTARQLYESSWPIVEATLRELSQLARNIGAKHRIELPTDDMVAVALVDEWLTKDHPKSDAEMFDWYKSAGVRLVDFARVTKIFDVPAAYALDVMETPPPLRGSGAGGASYYPAPPFKGTGVGRFYLSPTQDDPAELARVARAGVADLAAHEGFPGHDWNYKVMTHHANAISPVRWLTPGAVEDSSSMWQDSIASEGWGLYAESLMAEPAPGAPTGFYTDEERFYVLWSRLYRELRVRIDTGLHIGALSFDDAVDVFLHVMYATHGSCRDPALLKDAKKQAACRDSKSDIHRYAMWPTQAVAYRLGKDAIVALRKRAHEALGTRFDLKAYHLAFMRQGSIPPTLFGDELMRELGASL